MNAPSCEGDESLKGKNLKKRNNRKTEIDWLEIKRKSGNDIYTRFYNRQTFKCRRQRNALEKKVKKYLKVVVEHDYNSDI